MITYSSSRNEIYQEVRSRLEEKGSMPLVEFDDVEYQVLKQCSQNIIKEKRVSELERYIFVAFACEFVRRNIYLRDNAFWNDIGVELKGIPDQNFITYDILWSTFDEIGIHKIHGKDGSGQGNRQIVESLIKSIKMAAQVTHEQFGDFFCWSYQRSEVFRIDATIIRSFEEETGRKFLALPKAYSRIVRDYLHWLKEIQLASEQSVREQGAFSYFDSLRLSDHDKRLIKSLWMRIQNYYTPGEFRSKLKKYPGKILTFPDGTSRSVRRTIQEWDTKEILYGSYRVDNVCYRVVPQSRLLLETITEWPYQKFVEPRHNYIAYKSTQPFTVHIGSRTSEAHKCFFEDKGMQPCYIWMSQAPQGERLSIDGKVYSGTIGLDWHFSPELHFDEDGQASVVLVLDHFKAFYPDKIGQKLTICTSQGDKKVGMVREDGTYHLKYGAISFPIVTLGEALTLSVFLNENCIESKVVNTETAYLFSLVTYKRIPPSLQATADERRFFLISPISTSPISTAAVSLRQHDLIYDSHDAYDVEWREKEQPFSLQVGDKVWIFQKYLYFYVQLQQHSEESIQLTGQQLQFFDQAQIRVFSNRILRPEWVFCQFCYEDESEEVEVIGGLRAIGENTLILSSEMIEGLNKLSIEKHRYGQYHLCFFEEEQQLGEVDVVIIPYISVDTSQEHVFLEKEAASLSISSSHLDIWDSKAKLISHSIQYLFRPKMVVRHQLEEAVVPEGIPLLVAEEETFPLVFPSIGQSIIVHFTPMVFGYRLYQKFDGKNTCQVVGELDYYKLEKSILHVFSKPYDSVYLYAENVRIEFGKADMYGNFFIEGLTFLKLYCKTEQTQITIISEGLKSTFIIRWTPRIYKMNVEEDRVIFTLEGPRNTGIFASFVDLNNNKLAQYQIQCYASRFAESIIIPPIQNRRKLYYLRTTYYLSNGDILPSMWHQRLNTVQEHVVLSDWLAVGAGISHEMLLDICSME